MIVEFNDVEPALADAMDDAFVEQEPVRVRDKGQSRYLRCELLQDRVAPGRHLSLLARFAPI